MMADAMVQESPILAHDWLRSAQARLEKAGVEQPAREARLLLSWHVYGDERAGGLFPDGPVLRPLHLESFLERRCAREPLAYIWGQKGFWKDDFLVGPGCLIPRPESEILIEEVLAQCKIRQNEAFYFAEAGTGSGCLSLSLLRELPQACSVATDISDNALGYARKNAAILGMASRISLISGDLLHPLAGEERQFDFVISNPPYIADAEMVEIQPEIRNYEPHQALKGGRAGLDFYRPLARQSRTLVKEAGLLIVEIGQNRFEAVKKAVEIEKWRFLQKRRDLNGIIRAMVFITD